jgi:hypothetical protein
MGGEQDEVANLTATESNERCRILFHYRNSVIEEEGSDYFEAFCQVRYRLEDARLFPFCYGASLNVYPSGMCRDMGHGLKAYRLTLGKQARTADLVHIFEAGDDVVPASVARQKEFFKDWLKSPRA